MQNCIKHYSEMQVFNASNGVYIEGATPLMLENWLSDGLYNQSLSSKSWMLWWNKIPPSSSMDRMRQWQAARPRAYVSDTINQLKSLLLSEEPWFPIVQDKINELLLLNVPIHAQIGRRLIRALFLKASIVISRQCYVLLQQDSTSQMQLKFLTESGLFWPSYVIK